MFLISLITVVALLLIVREMALSINLLLRLVIVFINNSESSRQASHIAKLALRYFRTIGTFWVHKKHIHYFRFAFDELLVQRVCFRQLIDGIAGHCAEHLRPFCKQILRDFTEAGRSSFCVGILSH